MPIYLFDCPDCGEIEMIVKPGENEANCPTCNKLIKKVFSSKGQAFILKGENWSSKPAGVTPTKIRKGAKY